MFRVGQKVARFKDGPRSNDGTTKPPIGEVCTVSWVGFIEQRDRPVIDLVEYPRPETDDVYRGWDVEYFRPIVSRPTSIAVFEEILRKVNAPGRVTA